MTKTKRRTIYLTEEMDKRLIDEVRKSKRLHGGMSEVVEKALRMHFGEEVRREQTQ